MEHEAERKSASGTKLSIEQWGSSPPPQLLPLPIPLPLLPTPLPLPLSIMIQTQIVMGERRGTEQYEGFYLLLPGK